MAGASGVTAQTHLAAHLLREIEGGLHEVFERYSTKRQSSGHRTVDFLAGDCSEVRDEGAVIDQHGLDVHPTGIVDQALVGRSLDVPLDRPVRPLGSNNVTS
jgi:hypothetical protein